MDCGKEFSSWESFMHSLEQYSKEHKVVYTVGNCKPVETANRNDSLKNKFPVKFKYCFARMLCKHYGNYSSRSAGHRPHQRTCKTGCTSSILVSVNKKRSALVIKEANLEHTHDMSESIFNKYSQNRRLQGEELRMASVLLRAGVPLNRVQEFISNSCSKSPTIKDLQNIKTSMRGSLPDKEGHEFEFLIDLDQLMADDPESVVEIINFDLVPGAIYLQTSEMTKRMNSLTEGMLQLVSHSVNNGKMSVVSVLGLDKDFHTHILAFCIVIVGGGTSFQYFMEAFVRNNPGFCDTVTGLVHDCEKNVVDFIQQLIPQAEIAFSREYITNKFAEEVSGMGTDASSALQLQEELMNTVSEESYEEKLKELLNCMSPLDSKEFLRTWDSCKEMWAQYEISSHGSLRHQKTAVEKGYVDSLKLFVNSPITLSDLIKVLLKFDRNENPEEITKQLMSRSVDSSSEVYHQLCFPEAAQAIISQIAVALTSEYEIKKQSDMIFVKRRDNDDDFILDVTGSRCTCPYFLDSDMPCQHIFAWLKFSNKSLYNESLIPEKCHVFGKAITLNALAESLTQGHVPSSFQHHERLKELQIVLKDILTICCSHSYEQMGKDLALLKQILSVVKTRSSQSIKVIAEEEAVKSAPESHSRNDAVATTPTPRRRGRPRKDAKQQQTGSGAQNSKTAMSPQKLPTPSVGTRHNLRTNIKHKFVTRDLSGATDTSASQGPSKQKHLDETVTDLADDKIISAIISPDRTELSRKIMTKTGKTVTTLGQLASISPADETDLSEIKDQVSQKSVNENKFAQLTGARLLTDYKQKLQAGYNVNQPRRGRRPLSMTHVGTKRSFSDMQDDSAADDDEDDDEEDDDEDESMGEMGSEEDTDLETLETKRARKQKEIERFLENTPQTTLNEVMQAASSMEPPQQQDQNVRGGPENPVEMLIRSCQNHSETIDFIVDQLKKSWFGYSNYAYQVGACIVRKALQTHESVTAMTQTISYWPSHLPELPATRQFEEEIILSLDQTLTVCGHKLNQNDMDSLRPESEVNSKVLHAYLEVLAQKHSGKMFVIPFDVILMWKEGRYSENIFHKVHFKTFEYLVLPIHCGGEFTETERESGELVSPCWMALVADLKNKTVAVLNPRTEDKYIIAANGYMLQWRRYMQIRSVHTREMLSSWTTTQIPCSKLESEHNSAVCLLMNIEALINNVPPVIMTEAHVSRYLHYIALALRDMDRETTVLCVGGPECQQLAARDADWLQCENCRTWWHRACAGHSDRDLLFYCSSCQQRISIVKDRSEKDMADTMMVDYEEEEEEEDQMEEMENRVGDKVRGSTDRDQEIMEQEEESQPES